jgi:hypothetical protein
VSSVGVHVVGVRVHLLDDLPTSSAPIDTGWAFLSFTFLLTLECFYLK